MADPLFKGREIYQSPGCLRLFPLPISNTDVEVGTLDSLDEPFVSFFSASVLDLFSASLPHPMKKLPGLPWEAPQSRWMLGLKLLRPGRDHDLWQIGSPAEVMFAKRTKS